MLSVEACLDQRIHGSMGNALTIAALPVVIFLADRPLQIRPDLHAQFRRLLGMIRGDRGQLTLHHILHDLIDLLGVEAAERFEPIGVLILGNLLAVHRENIPPVNPPLFPPRRI